MSGFDGMKNKWYLMNMEYPKKTSKVAAELGAGVPPVAELPEPEEIDVAHVLDMYLSGEIDLICVLGPTASGKTRFAVQLAREIDRLLARPAAEIISADSRQVYKGMDIGTGKDIVEYQEIPYHLIDIVPAGARYNIYDYQQDFEAAYHDIKERGGVPVLCGGSGLYIEAATCGYRLPHVEPDMELRARLEEEDAAVLRSRLLEMRPETSEGVMQSKRRIIRALEVAMYEEQHPVERTCFLPKNVYYIGTLVSREERNARIDRRLDARLQEGMADEVRGLLASGIPPQDLVYYGLEYKYVTQYVQGIITFEEMRTLLANAIHQFAKRQMTWFRGMERDGLTIHWTVV